MQLPLGERAPTSPFLALPQIGAPILPLALLPTNAKSALGTAYGAIEVMFVLSQLVITLLVGPPRLSTPP